MRRYAEMFELDAIDTEELISYLEYWDVLRMCCGMQMSRGWRQELERGTEIQFSAHQVCKKHIDIGVKERDFIKLPLTIQIAKIKLLSVIARPSLQDGVLDGNYCERYRDFVKSGRSAFNRGIDGVYWGIKKYDSYFFLLFFVVHMSFRHIKHIKSFPKRFSPQRKGSTRRERERERERKI